MRLDSADQYENQLIAAKKFIEDNDDFLVVSHVSPDGDAASSTAAIGWILRRLGKRYTLINEDEMPEKFNFLWCYSSIQKYDNQTIQGSYTAVITVDCADFSRIGAVYSLFSENVQLLNIDHHQTNDYFGTHHLINSNAAATAEILFDLCVAMHLEADFDFSECIYTGLLTDTGGFRYSNTSPKVMQIAANLLSLGIRGSFLAETLLERMTFAQMNLLKKTLMTLSFSPDRKIAWVCVTEAEMNETGASQDDLDGLVNYPRNVEGVEVGILFKQREKDVYKISLRSNGRSDVSKVAQHFGGGGHVRAAGCTLQGDLQHIVDQVVKEVGNSLQ